VPSLVLFNRIDVESAAEKDLISPINETGMDADTDWYEYGRNLGTINGLLYGIPLAGDTLVLVYNTQLVTQDQLIGIDSWNSIISLEKPVAFNAGDPQAVFPLSMYLSAGGIVQDEDLQPALSAPVLTEVYRIFEQGSVNGVFPAWVSDIQNDDEAWTRLRYGEADFLVTTVSSYLENHSGNFLALPLPALNTGNYALVDGWMWSVSDRDPQRRVMAESLAEFLSSAEFLSEWSQAAGYLPVRPSAMVSWPAQSEKALLGKVILSLQEMPPAEVIKILQVPIKEGTLKVIESGVEAFQAADQAAKTLQAED
jgi:ABC-type glycerol-3-phosphate transport system substrate-binding protein